MDYNTFCAFCQHIQSFIWQKREKLKLFRVFDQGIGGYLKLFAVLQMIYRAAITNGNYASRNAVDRHVLYGDGVAFYGIFHDDSDPRRFHKGGEEGESELFAL